MNETNRGKMAKNKNPFSKRISQNYNLKSETIFFLFIRFEILTLNFLEVFEALAKYEIALCTKLWDGMRVIHITLNRAKRKLIFSGI